MAAQPVTSFTAGNPKLGSAVTAKSPLQDEEVIRKCRQLLTIPAYEIERPASPVRDMIAHFDSVFCGFVVGQRQSSSKPNVTAKAAKRVRPTPVGKPQTAVPIKDIETPVELLSPTKSPGKQTAKSPEKPVQCSTEKPEKPAQCPAAEKPEKSAQCPAAAKPEKPVQRPAAEKTEKRDQGPAEKPGVVESPKKAQLSAEAAEKSPQVAAELSANVDNKSIEFAVAELPPMAVAKIPAKSIVLLQEKASSTPEKTGSPVKPAETLSGGKAEIPAKSSEKLAETPAKPAGETPENSTE